MNAYLITNLVNGKRYVGISANARSRWSNHKALRKMGKCDTLLQKAMAKHGVENFSFEIIASCGSWVDLCATEQSLIEQHGTFWKTGHGYNMTPGGQGTPGPKSLESREKIRIARTGRTHSDEAKRKMSAAKRGKSLTREHVEKATRHLREKAKTPEHKAKIASAHVGLGHTPAARAKMSASRSGVKRRPHSQKTRAKIAAALLGNKNGYGQNRRVNQMELPI